MAGLAGGEVLVEDGDGLVEDLPREEGEEWPEEEKAGEVGLSGECIVGLCHNRL